MVNAEHNIEYLSDKQHAGRFDHSIIRMDYDWEVIYWCMVLQCTKKELEDAVRKVGNAASDIRQLIRGN